jgi:HSP20 family protein
MSLMRNSDWRGFRSEIDRLFEDFLSPQRGLSTATQGQGKGTFWAPAVDISENGDSFVVHAELPGVKQEDIDIELEDSVLTLKGQRNFERKDEKENFHFVERSYGSFYRSFTLPRNVDPNGIQASFTDGVLTITVPKAEQAKPRKVEIGAGSAAPAKGKEIPAKGKTMAAGASE